MPKLLITLFLLFCSLAAEAELLTPVPDRPEAPEFALSELDGTVHQLSDYRGKVVVVNFWATWCPPCRKEMPSMQRAWEQMRKEDMVLLAINAGENRKRVKKYLASESWDFPLLLDPNTLATGHWPVKGLPTTFVIDPQGRFAYQAVGGREWDDPEILQLLRELKQPD